ncbi:RICIN domain-containing protein [Micromonospora sp. NPDC004540]|uniref:RICIN domain-containing protein n=1 Tax=Micromonospora sp. NPDC004540 TaxID=3154457 RepID=UPI0033AF7665
MAYTLPARTTATFTWAGSQSGGGGGGTPTGPITGVGGKCLDVTDNSSADGTPAQIWSCTGEANQKWTLPS